jgi:hypothetical protein
MITQMTVTITPVTITIAHLPPSLCVSESLRLVIGAAKRVSEGRGESN